MVLEPKEDRMDRVPRTLSFSEIDTALTCQARWDFQYGGRLQAQGDNPYAVATLKPRQTAMILSEGKAWGAGVAAWHQHSGTLLAMHYAVEAIHKSLAAEAAQLERMGFPVDTDTWIATENKLLAILDNYAAVSEPLPNFSRIEEEIVVAIPSRGGRRSSTLYRFLCYLDGYTDKASGERWLVEFKLRKSLQEAAQAELSRQYRWYAWSEEKKSGHTITGVLVDETLNEPPRDAARTPTGKLSHRKDQWTTVDRYVDACRDEGVNPSAEAVQMIGDRVWTKRIPLMYRPSEQFEHGLELVSGAKLIRDLDNGELYPIRNAKPMTCRSCRFRAICANPRDRLYVDTLFTRSLPKRYRDGATVTPTERRA
jgi:hypothetical protein